MIAFLRSYSPVQRAHSNSVHSRQPRHGSEPTHLRSSQPDRCSRFGLDSSVRSWQRSCAFRRRSSSKGVKLGIPRVASTRYSTHAACSVYENCLVACQTIWTRSGIGGFYRGAQVTLARDILWNGLSYAFFTNWKAAFVLAMGRDSSASEDLLLGALGGSVAAVFTQPLDVAKTRIMIQKAGEVAKYKGVFATILLLLKEEGPLVLFAGLLTRIVYLAPFASLVFSANEFIKKQLIHSRPKTIDPSKVKK